MTFYLVYIAAMLLPGALAARLLGLQDNGGGASIALSLTLLVVLVVISRAAGLGTDGLTILLTVGYAGIVGGIVAVWRFTDHRLLPNIELDWTLAIPTATLSLVLGYTMWVGPYTEVPADAWWHLDKIQENLEDLQRGQIGDTGGFEGAFARHSEYWYLIAAYFLYASGMQLHAALTPLAAANMLLFCIGVYSFALFVFKTIVASRPTRHAMAASSVFFFIAQFGVSVFSYVRYYVYAPTLLNYIIYLTAIACFIRFLMESQGSYRLLTLLTVFTIVAAILHTQEALFILTMVAAILLVVCSRTYFNTAGTRSGRCVQKAQFNNQRTVVLFLFVLALYVFVHGVAYVYLPRSNPLEHDLLADIRHYLPFVQNLYILQPTKQFYQVLTVWGVLVYVMFLVQRRSLAAHPYITAGMVIPLLTVFNPVFVDLFLRFQSPAVLWRICYVIPLPMLGGFFFVKCLENGRLGRTIWHRTVNVVLAAALLVLLLPVNTIYFTSPFSKIYTLKAVEPENDHRLWGDLLEFLRWEETSDVITDRVTGYVIDGLTEHEYRGYKFTSLYAPKIALDSYDDKKYHTKEGWKKLVREGEFEVKRDWLVIINTRDGAPSVTGHVSGHWPKDIMKVSRQYSNAFIDYVGENPRMFRKIWERAQIKVYEIRQD